MLVIVLMGCSKDTVNNEVNQQPENSCVYNDMYWGTDRADVISEKGEPVSYYPDYTLQYNEQFINEECKTSYYFDSDCKLNKIDVVKDTTRSYEDVKNTLIEMYGEPLSEEIDKYSANWANWIVGNTSIKLEVDEHWGNYCVYYSLNPIE